MIHYISTQGGRKIVTIETNEIVNIDDCERIINEQEIEQKWVSVVDEKEEEIPEVDKMEVATKDVESYMSETEVKTETKKSSKKK